MPPRSLTHFPSEQCIVAQIGRFGGSEIPAHTNPFELLSTYQDVQEEDDEQPATPTPKPRRRHRRAKRRKTKWKYKYRQPSDGEEEVSEEAEKEHWCNFIEQLDRAESRAHLPVSPFTDSQSQGNILAGGRAIIGEVATLVYFDTGCSIDGLMDLKCFKEMVAAGAKWEPSQLPTVKLKSASGHDIECVQAVRTFVVIETPSGPRQAELTFGVMKGKLSLGGLIGMSGLIKLDMTLKCGDSSAQILPEQNGRMPRAHVLKSEVLAKTVGYNSIPPNSSSAVFVIGPISDAAVGSDAIAEPGFGPWAGLTGQTLTTILQDKCKRKGAFVLVTNPSPSKSIIIPPDSPIAKLDINWRCVRAEAISGGTEPEAIREEYKSGPRRFPIMTITTGEETVGAMHTSGEAT